MERLFDFVQNHPLLVGTFFALLIVFFLLESKRGGKKVSPQQIGLLSNQGAKIIDIREPKEFKDGHISSSRNIPYSSFKDHVDELKAETNPLIIVCKMGTSASAAIQQLEKDNVYRLDGGMMNWKAQGLPVIKEKSGNAGKKKKKKK